MYGTLFTQLLYVQKFSSTPWKYYIQMWWVVTNGSVLNGHLDLPFETKGDEGPISTWTSRLFESRINRLPSRTPCYKYYKLGAEDMFLRLLTSSRSWFWPPSPSSSLSSSSLHRLKSIFNQCCFTFCLRRCGQ